MSSSLAAMTFLCFVSLHQTMPSRSRVNVIKVLPLFICAQLYFALTERQSSISCDMQLLNVIQSLFEYPVLKLNLPALSKISAKPVWQPNGFLQLPKNIDGYQIGRCLRLLLRIHSAHLGITGFLWVLPTKTGFFLRGLKISGENST